MATDVESARGLRLLRLRGKPAAAARPPAESSGRKGRRCTSGPFSTTRPTGLGPASRVSRESPL